MFKDPVFYDEAGDFMFYYCPTSSTKKFFPQAGPHLAVVRQAKAW